MRLRWLFVTPSQTAPALGLLVLRLGAGGLLLVHGWGKLADFNGRSGSFPDPLGLGPALSMFLVTFAEFFCSIAIILGVLTRVAAVPIISTMIVAAFVVHGADPLADKELALLYLAAFLAILLVGAGRYSVDGALARGGK